MNQYLKVLHLHRKILDSSRIQTYVCCMVTVWDLCIAPGYCLVRRVLSNSCNQQLLNVTFAMSYHMLHVHGMYVNVCTYHKQVYISTCICIYIYIYTHFEFTATLQRQPDWAIHTPKQPRLDEFLGPVCAWHFEALMALDSTAKVSVPRCDRWELV